jgi:DMSO/TMAO reductase YedYZ molybdopterin-dependent catalytic subunit
VSGQDLGRSRARDLTGALCGIAAGGAALAVAQVLGAAVPGAQPPLQVLGDFVIRVSPVSLNEALIRQVGRSDKLVLMVSVLVVATLAAALVGVRFVRGRVRSALMSIGLLVLLPVLAARGEAQTSVLRELLVLAPAGLLGAGLLWVLGRPLLTAGPPAGTTAKQARRAAAEHAALVSSGREIQRRQLLLSTVVLATSALLGTTVVRQLGKASPALMSRLAAALPTPKQALAPLVDELASLGASPLVTANDRFYRIDTALTPPLVEPDTWALTVSRDGRPLATYSYDQLMERATYQADVTIGCVSNEVGGDLIGTARWQGVLLADLLRESGVTRAGRVAGVSVDGWFASFAGALAFDGRPAMVAVGMNGEPLPVKHGFPARLVVPGLYGYTSATKWLQAIDVSDRTDLPGFWADRGWAPAVDVHVTSRIDAPRDGASVAAGTVPLAGIAWAPLSGVGAVEVQVDDGPWQPARLSKAVSGTLWRQWALDWRPVPGTYRVRVRASDADGRPQDTQRRPVFPSGATGLHEVRVTVR